MRTLLFTLTTLLLLSTNLFSAQKLTEESITKVLDSVNIAKEHMNMGKMQKYFLGRTSVSLTEQNVDDSETKRYSFYQYKNLLNKKWKKLQSNLIEVQERKFNIEADGKSALVKTTLLQTIEKDGKKFAVTIHETTGIKLMKGTPFINYYSSRAMLHTEKSWEVKAAKK